MKNGQLVFGYVSEFGYEGSFWELSIRSRLCWLLGHEPYPFSSQTLEQKRVFISIYDEVAVADKYFCGKCSRHIKFPKRIMTKTNKLISICKKELKNRK